MSLYRNIGDGKSERLTDGEERQIRNAITADGKTGPLLRSENGFDFVCSDEQAAEIRGVWTRSEEAMANAVPAAVSALSFKVALNRGGLLEQVEKLVSEAGGESALRWKGATIFERNHPLLIAAAAQLNLSDDQVDDLFRLAAKL